VDKLLPAATLSLGSTASCDIKSTSAVTHNLVREGSRAINSTESDQNLLRSKECTLNKGDNFANIGK
jgi:hypothetical protein